VGEHGGTSGLTPSVVAVATSTNTTIGAATTYGFGASVVMTTAGTPYQLASLSLAAGTWAVTGELETTGVSTPYLSGTAAAATNLAPVTTGGGSGLATAPQKTVSMVVTVPVTTTVYLNASSAAAADTGYGSLTAIRIL
jgi:hypothetical protein